jgi:alanyl-tRNA synthetase
LKAADIRDLFRDFFADRGHIAGEPASLVPAGDTSVLFTTAGMQQFKPYYLGVETPPASRMTTCQRCFRTSDIENVGKTGRHLTFFEMLGNFSFGSYFKAEATKWALEFSDEIGISRDRVWVSVYGGDGEVPADTEAIELWKDLGIPADRIVSLGRGDNFWGPAGPTGPCGPCSELYFDMGPEAGCGSGTCAPGCECDRFMEYWNLVFVQYEMDAAGGLTPLREPSIDTGMGLERIATVTQGVRDVYETDLFSALMASGSRLAGVLPEDSPVATRALRVMAEHARAAAFLIMDGVLPGNEGRDYVLRRVIRRAVQQGVSIGLEKPFLAGLAGQVVDEMGAAYPQLIAARSEIERVVSGEEVRFRRTLDQGMGIIEEALRRARSAGSELPAEVAFELHDTYGFPFDLTREIAAESDMSVDEERFEHLMEEQRQRARAAQKSAGNAEADELNDFQRRNADLPVTFVGYERLEVFTVIRAIGELADGRLAVKLAESPFYAEGGGQVADLGWVHTESGKLEVDTVVRFETDQVVVARQVEGRIVVGERAKAMVNTVRRHQTACNHTATHLLHNALRIVLGDSVRQAGSMVRPERLRFDFSVRGAPSQDELRQVEDLVNRRIVESHAVRPFVTTKEYAAEIGALAFFEDKYGEFVRVLEIDDFSRELCGGTHVSSTSQIGLFRIMSSQSVGANTRRIEAITSAKAIEHYRRVEAEWNGLAAELEVKPERLTAAVAKLRAQLTETQARLKTAERGGGQGKLEALLAGLMPLGDVSLVVGSPEVDDSAELLTLADQVHGRHPEAIVLLAAAHDGKAALVVSAGDAAVGRGIHAAEILRAMLPAVDGRGGGKPNLARGGGTNAAGTAAALDAGAARARALLGL